MAGSTSKIAIEVVANALGMDKGLRGAEMRLSKFNSSVHATARNTAGSFVSMGRSVAGFGAAITGLGVGGGLAGLGAGLKASIDRLDDLGDQAKGIGTTAESLSKIGYVALRVGSSAEAVTGGIKKMERSLAEASTKGGKTAEMIEALGLNLTELTQMDPVQAFEQIVYAIGSLPSTYDKAAASQAIFGKSASELMQFFADTTEIGKFADDFDRLHGNVGLAAEVAGGAQDELDRLKQATMGFGEQAVIAFGPQLTGWIKNMADAIGGFNNSATSVNTMTESLAGLTRTMESVAGAAKVLVGMGLWVIGDERSQTGTGAVNQAKLEKWKMRGEIGNATGQDIARRAAGMEDRSGRVSMAEALMTEGQRNILGTTKRTPAVVASATPAATPAGESRSVGDSLKYMEDQEKIAKEVEQIQEKFADPLEELEAQIQKIQDLYDAGAIDEGLYYRALNGYLDDYNKNLQKTQEEQDRLLNPDAPRRGRGYTNLSASGGAGIDGPGFDPMMDRFMQYNTLPGGFVGGSIPDNQRTFTPPEWGSRQVDFRSNYSESNSSYGMDENNRLLKAIADGVQNAAMVA